MLVVQKRLAALANQVRVQSLRWLAYSAVKRREPGGSNELDITWAQLKRLQDCSSPSELVVIDVRCEEDAFRRGILKGAINIPLDDLYYAFLLPEDRFLSKYGCRKPNEDTQIVLYCSHNRRAQLARRKLAYFGIPGCICLSGGIEELYKERANS
ncbi:unnamed protein product [Dibothriocephalus latus]|uniref:Rhodanese domain-containing protein n=1 Tax=Dibothriocephalus latus TaxID=60516 RepID=A0A3P7LN54_DIBLA|nr:unnamed protein product [Dibothriocephalus latus]